MSAPVKKAVISRPRARFHMSSTDKTDSAITASTESTSSTATTRDSHVTEPMNESVVEDKTSSVEVSPADIQLETIKTTQTVNEDKSAVYLKSSSSEDEAAAAKAEQHRRDEERKRYETAEKKRLLQEEKEKKAIEEARKVEEEEHRKQEEKQQRKSKSTIFKKSSATKSTSSESARKEMDKEIKDSSESEKSIANGAVATISAAKSTSRETTTATTISTITGTKAKASPATTSTSTSSSNTSTTDVVTKPDSVAVSINSDTTAASPGFFSRFTKRKTADATTSPSASQSSTTKQSPKKESAISIQKQRHFDDNRVSKQWSHVRCCALSNYFLWLFTLFSAAIAILYLLRNADNHQYIKSTGQSVSGVELADGAVTNSKLAAGAVATVNVQPRSITSNLLATDVLGILSNLTDLTSFLNRSARTAGTGLILNDNYALRVNLDSNSLTINSTSGGIAVKALTVGQDDSVTLTSGQSSTGITLAGQGVFIEGRTQVKQQTVDVTSLIYYDTVAVNTTGQTQNVTTKLVQSYTMDFSTLTSSLLSFIGNPSNRLVIDVVNCTASRSGTTVILLNNMNNSVTDALSISQDICNTRPFLIFPGQFIQLTCLPTSQVNSSIGCQVNDGIDSGSASNNVGVGKIGLAANATFAGENATVFIEGYSGVVEISTDSIIVVNSYVSFTMYNSRITEHHVAIRFTTINSPFDLQLSVRKQTVQQGQATVVFYLTGSGVFDSTAEAFTMHFQLV